MGKVVAFFITPHGFGHASRACSVIQALSAKAQFHRLLIFTTVPRWFFEASLDIPFEYFSIQTDIGLIQTDPLKVNLVESLKELDRFLPFSPSVLKTVTKILAGEQCDLVVSDISALGIKVAHQMKIPSILIENFTWDWIYQDYIKQAPEFERYADYLQEVYDLADWHILAEPFCQNKKVDLICKPISRRPKTAKNLIRNQLNIELDRRVVIVSMGGIESNLQGYDKLKEKIEITFLIPGTDKSLKKDGNIIFIPHQTNFYHPDLIQASDAVISKIGYSTIAEVYQTGKPFGFISRTGFRESKELENYVQLHMAGLEISENEYRSGNWVVKLKELISLPKTDRSGKTGAEQAAKFILDKLNI